MVRVGVIGGGQLARMMIPAALNLGIELRVFAESEGSSAAMAATYVGDYANLEELTSFAHNCDVITFDHEHVPIAHLEALCAEGVGVYPPPGALALTHDKIVMRRALQDLGVPQPRWTVIESSTHRDQALGEVGGFPCVAKLPVGGYDGKGVRVIASWAEAEEWCALGPVLLEEKVDFRRELAQLGARRPSGEWVAWPVVETRQVNGVCSEVLAPAPGMSAEGARQAESIASTIASAINVVGVLAVELFETADGRILVNELAMRPHNSGHVFTELSLTSQFEQHLRAVTDFPLGAPELIQEFGVMANIFGRLEGHLAKLAAEELPAVKIHDYQKAPRLGRKVGHCVAVGSSVENSLSAALAARAILEGDNYDGQRGSS